MNRNRLILLGFLMTVALLVGCRQSPTPSASPTSSQKAGPTLTSAQSSLTFTPPPTAQAVPTFTPSPATPTPSDLSPGLIVFYSERDGDAEIYVMDADGSNQRALTDNAYDDFSPAWSPDGSLIIFESDRDDPSPRTCFPNCNYNLYLMRADGSDQRQLTSLPGSEWHADWSPDGKSLVFNLSEVGFDTPGIYRYELETGEIQPILKDEFSNNAPDWSPDGKRMLFSSDREGALDIYMLNVESGAVIMVADTGMNDYFPDWSPDGEKVAFFAADFPSVKQDIFTVNLDGSQLVNLNNTPQVVDEDPMWSPDGKKIIFQTDRDGNFEIYSMNVDGSQPENLTRDRGRDYVPSMWMPGLSGSYDEAKSHKIAFVSVRDGDGEIYTMNGDGSDVQQLTHNSVWDGFPAWSPDGSQIAYYSYLGSKSWVIMVMDADGANPRQLTGGEQCDGAPYWSPDGLWIAYMVDAACNAEARQIAIVGVDGKNFHFLTQDDADNMGHGWSPDGRRFLFSSNRDGDEEIYIISTDGSGLQQLTENDYQDIMPAWSPDGKQIAFVSDRDGNQEIYLMDLEGGAVIRITDDPAKDWFPAWTADGEKMLFNSWREDGDLEVYIMNRDGSDIRRLTTSPGEDFNAVWH